VIIGIILRAQNEFAGCFFFNFGEEIKILVRKVTNKEERSLLFSAFLDSGRWHRYNAASNFQ
jgi:hypothetical protein